MHTRNTRTYTLKNAQINRRIDFNNHNIVITNASVVVVVSIFSCRLNVSLCSNSASKWKKKKTGWRRIKLSLMKWAETTRTDFSLDFFSHFKNSVSTKSLSFILSELFLWCITLLSVWILWRKNFPMGKCVNFRFRLNGNYSVIFGNDCIQSCCNIYLNSLLSE